MAGGKLTPRQKMINLMYLVFIAMLALNMSKEVLSAFGLMNERFEEANNTSTETNDRLLAALETKASDNPTEFSKPLEIAKKVDASSKEFFSFMDGLKTEALKGVEASPETGKLPYEQMDKADNLDNLLFIGDKYSDKAKAFIAAIEKYKNDVKTLIGADKKHQNIVDEVVKKFTTEKVKDRENVSREFLEYHFKGFPAIASIAKLTAFQNDVKSIENEILNALIGNKATEMASFKNYTAIAIPEKSAYFSGESVKGKIVLARYDKSTVPTSVVVNGQSVNLATALKDGQVNFNFGAGNVGDHEIKGKFTFMEDGKPVPIDFTGNYVVVNRPNSATISADKMNVLYRGVSNPITVSFAGIPANKVSVSAPGLSSAGKPGQYVIKPGQGTEVTINVTGTLPDNSKVSDKKSFRIKSIPAPVGAVGGEVGNVKGAKSRLMVSQVSAKLLDFDFNVDINVVGFTLKVPGQAAVVVQGDRINAQCQAALARATRGDQVTISEIKTRMAGSDLLLLKCAPVIFEIQ